MKKILITFILLLSLLTSLASCGEQEDRPISAENSTGTAVSEPIAEPSNGVGESSVPGENANGNLGNEPENNNGAIITNGNLVNGSRVTSSGEWVYFSLWDGIYRMRPDGTEQEMIYKWDTRSSPSPIIVVGEWIYTKRFYPYIIKIDGTEVQQISDFQYIGSFRVIGDWLYFGSEYKMKLDGSDLQQIYSKNRALGYTVNIVDNWIYFCDLDEQGNECIYKLKTDGTNKQAIYNGRTDYMVVEDGWIYYEEYNSKDLYKMKTDGSENQLIVKADKILSLNVADGWVYYGGTFDTGEHGICRIRTDGSEKQVLCADNAINICIIDDWVYYAINGGEYVDGEHVDTLYRIRTDGLNKEPVMTIPYS